MKLVAELTPPAFAELGRPIGSFPNAKGDLVALCSEFNMFYWPGRAIYGGHRPRFRVSLYDSDWSQLKAVFDESRLPINHVAFHPTAPYALVSTGCYDGGHMFEGSLWLWNWESGEYRSLLDESRQVVACRFLDDHRAHVLLRPYSEEEFEDIDPFVTVVGLTLDVFSDKKPELNGLVPVQPESLGFSESELSRPGGHPDFDRRALEEFGWEERTRVWDLAWLSDDRLAVVHDNCHVEVWDTSGERILKVKGDGFGVQVFDSGLLHVLQSERGITGLRSQSHLYRVTDTRVERLVELDSPFLFSQDSSGRILARQLKSRKETKRDLILGPDVTERWSRRLGEYDCFNHYVRIDGADSLYFLRGEQPEEHRGKELVRIGQDDTVEEVLLWDGGERHLMTGAACFATSKRLLRTYMIHHPRPSICECRIDCCDLRSGKTIWIRAVEKPVVALAKLDDKAVFSLTNGHMLVLRIEDGELLWEGRAQINGVATMVMSLAARGTRVAAGTVCGRVLLYELP